LTSVSQPIAAEDSRLYTLRVELIVSTEITCPHCGEVFPIQVDTSQAEQTLIEDCTVCCRPITLTIRSDPGEVVDLNCSGGL
jgi:hypothetical protein